MKKIDEISSVTLIDGNGFIYDVQKDGTTTPKNHSLVEDIKSKNIRKKDSDALLEAYAAFMLPNRGGK